jgi:hypothetical protein
MCSRIVDTDEDGARDLTRRRRYLGVPNVGDDDGAATGNTELRAVVLADPDALGEPERVAQPIDGRTDVGIDQDRDDHRRRD